MEINFSKNVNKVNRKLHIHIGLFLFLFIWLFSFSGLLLNHGNWKFANFWQERKEKTTTNAIKIHQGFDSLNLLKEIITQRKLSGEIRDVQLNPDSVNFNISYPGHVKNIHVDLQKSIIIEKDIQFNIWGKLRTLHTFNGANKSKEDSGPNWLITRVWRFSMDAIAIGLIIITTSSWIMWYKVRSNYPFSALILIAGFIITIYFVFVIRMMK